MLRKVLIAMLLVLVAIAAHRAWDYVELRRLIAEIDAVRARSEPVTALEATSRLAPSPSGESEAGRYYLAAAMIVPLPNRDLSSRALHEWLAGVAPDPRAEIAPALQARVEGSRDALLLADKAATLGFSRLPPGTEYNYRTSHLLGLGRALSARTLTLSLLDQGDAAVDSAISALRLRRVEREVRWPVGSHETAAVLSLSRPSPAALGRLQRALAAEETRDEFVDGLLLERARFIEMLWRRRYGFDPAATRDYRLTSGTVVDTVSRPVFSRRAVKALRVWSALIDAARAPWPDRVDRVNAALRIQGDAGSDGPPSPFLVRPNVSPVRLITDRASLTAVAIERFRRVHADALPAALGDLVPAYLAALPIDPYSGAGLLFAKDGNAYTVYSVGPNRVDDRGDLTSELAATIKQGFGFRVIRGLDVGVRVVLRDVSPSQPLR